MGKCDHRDLKGKKGSATGFRSVNICKFNVCDLPREIFNLILQYLNIKELSNFDQAVLNHTLRPQYLSAIRNLIIEEYYAPAPWPEPGTNLEWIMTRGVLPLKITLNHYKPEMTELVNFSRTFFNTLCLGDRKFPLDLFCSLQECPSLTNLQLNHCDSVTTEMFNNFLLFNPQLESLMITRQSSFDLNSCLLICHHLKYLDLPYNYWINDDFVSQLCGAKFDLYSLDLSGSFIGNTSVQLLLDTFPNLHYLCLIDCNLSEEILVRTWQKLIPSGLKSDSLVFRSLSLEYLEISLEEISMISEDMLVTLVPIVLPFIKDPSEELRDIAKTILSTDPIPRLIVETNVFDTLLEFTGTNPPDELMFVILFVAQSNSTLIPSHLQYLLLMRNFIPRFLLWESVDQRRSCFHIVLCRMITQATLQDLIESTILLNLMKPVRVFEDMILDLLLSLVTTKIVPVIEYFVEIGLLSYLENLICVNPMNLKAKKVLQSVRTMIKKSRLKKSIG